MCQDTTGWFYICIFVYVSCCKCNVMHSIFISVFDFVPSSYLKMLKFLDQLVRRHMKFGIPKE